MRLGKRKRAILWAMELLAVDKGRPVSTEAIVDYLWASETPSPRTGEVWCTTSAVGRVLRNLEASGHVERCGRGLYVLRSTADRGRMIYRAWVVGLIVALVGCVPVPTSDPGSCNPSTHTTMRAGAHVYTCTCDPVCQWTINISNKLRPKPAPRGEK